MLSLGLAVIFGLLNIINFAHGAQYMMGAFVRLVPARAMLGIGYWWALLLAPLVVGAPRHRASSARCCSRLYKLDHLYGLLLTFGLALIIQGLFRNYYGSPACPIAIPDGARGRLQPRLHVPAELPRLGRSSRRSSSASAPGSSSSAPSSAPTCAPPPRTRRWCRPSASTCRA